MIIIVQCQFITIFPIDIITINKLTMLKRSLQMYSSQSQSQHKNSRSNSNLNRCSTNMQTRYNKNLHNKSFNMSRKSKSRYSSVSKQSSSSKSKNKNKNKKKELEERRVKMLLSQFDSKKGRKDRHVAYIPQTIRFKQTNSSKIGKLMRTQKYSKKQWVNQQNKQNEILKNNQNQENQPYILNRDLLKASQKPSRVNYMNRVSNIYDLIISKVMLPQFVEYFLGEALYAVNKSSKLQNSSSKIESIYDWRLDDFKRICQKIYQNSQQQDLKHFMSLSLPSINRWNSRMNSTKNQTLPNNTAPTFIADSRVTNNTVSSLNNKDRVSYFKSLNKRQKISLQGNRQSFDVLDKLNSKIDGYLKENMDKIQAANRASRKNQFENCRDLPLQHPKRARISFNDRFSMPNQINSQL